MGPDPTHGLHDGVHVRVRGHFLYLCMSNMSCMIEPHQVASGVYISDVGQNAYQGAAAKMIL